MRILAIEDGASVATQLTSCIKAAGYAVDQAADGERADFLVRTEQYDAMVLDLGLPKLDGLTLVKNWREAGLTTPVLILTARGNWHQKVSGHRRWRGRLCRETFRMEEVLARLRALIRRASGCITPELRVGSVALDPRQSRVTADGAAVKLTSHEFRVLSYLMHQRGRIVSQAELTEHIYAQDFDRDSNTVEVFTARLRRKLGSPIIETVRGLGYRIQ